MAAPVRLYFHGIPGGAGELGLFPFGPLADASPLQPVDRRPHGEPAAEPFAALAARLAQRFPDTPLHLVGFSLGAAAALRTARHLGARVTRIDLVSAAAPLQLGDFLGGMAGAPLFRLAAAAPGAFAAAAALQSLGARLAPGALFGMLFAGARGADAALAADPAFAAAMRPLLQQALTVGLALYRHELRLYVEDWSAELADVWAPVTLHHGGQDNWAPVAMAEALAHRLPRCAGLHRAEPLSHYSMLRAYLAA